MSRSTIYSRAALEGFMRGRCAVSSQHKLPTRQELLATATADVVDMLFGPGAFEATLDEAIANGTILTYGPHLSDRPIDVL